MICHPSIEAIIDHGIGNVDSSSEDLVQVSTQLVGDSALVYSVRELQVVELPIHVVDVVVEVTTDNNRSVDILPDDILDDINHSLGSLHLVWFFPRFEVAVQYLHLLFPSCHPRPVEICSQRFDKR